jgi:hypothetical protein
MSWQAESHVGLEPITNLFWAAEVGLSVGLENPGVTVKEYKDLPHNSVMYTARKCRQAATRDGSKPSLEPIPQLPPFRLCG